MPASIPRSLSRDMMLLLLIMRYAPTLPFSRFSLILVAGERKQGNKEDHKELHVVMRGEGGSEGRGRVEWGWQEGVTVETGQSKRRVGEAGKWGRVKRWGMGSREGEGGACLELFERRTICLTSFCHNPFTVFSAS